MKAIINVHYEDLYLVEFRYQGTESKFIVSLNQIAFRKACENNTLRVEILQRKGYKKVVFITES